MTMPMMMEMMATPVCLVVVSTWIHGEEDGEYSNNERITITIRKIIIMSFGNNSLC
jgi:hypothetical protein